MSCIGQDPRSRKYLKVQRTSQNKHSLCRTFHPVKKNKKKQYVLQSTLCAIPSLFTFRAMQPPEIGAMAKITLLHQVAYEKATSSSGLTSLGMKI
ncbi:hypothetical protein AVEN_128826-1 [Araneus ventricosus]|uniref:Uncharacterized protein n=1 Tax=Araneus ventricosus TaxID=182803 RepID=A0A4Y2II43_ARAVE|nr:hypothetical protein AVEN_128826-1 [Araneus ventricosus]